MCSVGAHRPSCVRSSTGYPSATAASRPSGPGTPAPTARTWSADYGDNASVFYYGRDELGSVTGLISTGGAVVNRYRYTPRGEYEPGTTETVYNPVRFAGSIYDAYPRLYFMRARYYGPELARFISEDPIGIGGGMNLYAYAGNNPVNFRDPFGLEPCTKRDKATGTAYQPDGTACELPGVVATGRKGGGGGTVYIGGSGRGGSGYRPTRGGRGIRTVAVRTKQWVDDNQRCIAAGAVTSISFVSDVAFAGAMAGAAATALSIGTAAVPVFVVAGAVHGIGGRVRPQIARAVAASAFDLNLNTAGRLAASATAVEVGGNVQLIGYSEMAGIGSHLSDLVPGLATRNAYRTARGACSAP